MVAYSGKTMQLWEFFEQVALEKDGHPRLRWGQVAFNLLYELRPELAGKVQGKSFDPFYASTRDDIRFKSFVKFLNDNWEDNGSHHD